MLLEKTAWFWKNGLRVISFMLILCISGCSDTLSGELQDDKAVIDVQTVQEILQEDEELVSICIELYEKAAKEKRNDDLEMIRSIVNRFGENGYPAIDSKNQIDMTEAGQVVEFCNMVDAKKEAQITMIEVSYFGGFTKYDLQTEDGKVDVIRSYYKYENGNIQRESTQRYEAEDWKYTEEGYLMFSGVLLNEESYVLTLSGVEEHTALRIQPLDETYRALSRKYLYPIGFEKNNMFIVDWSEDDFGRLNFDDMYAILYQEKHKERIPYVADDNLGVERIYRIPKDEYESVIMTYFHIDRETLQKNTVYHSEDSTYEYRPRGFEESEYPEYPYSEVIDFTENSDGTITLIANVIFPYEGNSKVYTHEVVVRPLEDGGVQYVSNRIIPSEDNCEATWYTPRLETEEEKDAQTSTESAYWFFPQAGDSLLSEEEEEQLQSMVLTETESAKEIYKDVIIADAPSYTSGVNEFTSEQRKAVVEQLGKAGLVSVEEDTNMQNHEEIEKFYSEYLKGQDSMVTVFEVEKDGLIGAVTFIYRKEKLQTYYIGVRWKEGGIPEIQGTLVSNIAEIKLTEKGYFIYAYEDVVIHANLREYWRIEPLSEECRKLTKEYISGLSYADYNMLVTNWDINNVEDILMPCMFEDIYRIHTGENLKMQNGEIPADEYEKIMTIYFPVSIEQLREHCGYDEGNYSYDYQKTYGSPYEPFGEVVDYMMNTDGTITLIVDGVWPDYNSDLAFRNKLVVQPFRDGTFRYLSNSVEQMELELPPIATIHETCS